MLLNKLITITKESKVKMNQNNKPSVAIIGCGWLGMPLAKSLIADEISVIGTRQSVAGIELLNQHKIANEQLVLPADSDTLAKSESFKQSTLVLAFPPQLKKGNADYAEKIKNIVQAAEKSGVKRIILVNSTGIYNGLSGEVDETTTLDESDPKAKVLAQAEYELMLFSGEKSVLRLSGLLGPQRHPGRFFKPGRKLSQPDAILNLIHQDDAVGLLRKLLEVDTPMGIYNGVSRTKGTKASFYQQAARSLNQPVPEFEQAAQINLGRRVNGDKARQLLGYTFVHDDLNDWVLSGG